MIALLLALLLSTAHAQTLERVARVIDGDTLVLSTGEVIRVQGVDAPELHPCRCASECALGNDARRWLSDRSASGVLVGRAGVDRYRRTLATVYAVDGASMAQGLIARGLARPYDGRTARRPWC